jgi:hypothetical protein
MRELAHSFRGKSGEFDLAPFMGEVWDLSEAQGGTLPGLLMWRRLGPQRRYQSSLRPLVKPTIAEIEDLEEAPM